MSRKPKWTVDPQHEAETLKSLTDWAGNELFSLDLWSEDGLHQQCLLPERTTRSKRSDEGGTLCISLRPPLPCFYDTLSVGLPKVPPGPFSVAETGGNCWLVKVNGEAAGLLLNKDSKAADFAGSLHFAILVGQSRLEWLERLESLERLHLAKVPTGAGLAPVTRIRGLQALGFYDCEEPLHLDELRGVAIAGLNLCECLCVGSLSVLGDMPRLVNLRISNSYTLGFNSSRAQAAIPIDGRQIELASRLETLSLCGLKLDNAACLCAMPQLQRVRLFTCNFDQQQLAFTAPGKLTCLQIGPYRLSSLEPLEALTNLEELTLNWAEDLKSLDGVERFQKLCSLELSGTDQLTSLEPLKALSKLEILELDASQQVCDASQLAHLSRLVRLDLGVPLKDASQLGNLTSLRSLSLSGTRITDLSFLNPDIRLESLQLSQLDELVDLCGLETQTGLKKLAIFSAAVLSNFAPIASLSLLQELSLSLCNRLKDISFLARLALLEDLTIEDSDELADIRPVGTLKHLVSLDLTSLPMLKDLAPLSACSGLEDARIWLDPNGEGAGELPDVSSLAGCTQLRRLNTGLEELPCAEVLAACATRRGDWRFIRDHGDEWLRLLLRSETAGKSVMVFLEAFLVARIHDQDPGLLEHLMDVLGDWAQAFDAAQERLEGFTREWVRNNGNHDGGV